MATLNDFLEWGRYFPAPIRENWGLFLDTILFGAGTGIDAPYKFSTDAGVTDPTAGYAKINNATVASATVMCVSITDRNGDSRTLTLESITKNDVLGLVSEAGGDEYIFKVTGDQVNHTTWFEIPVEYLSSSGALANNEDIIFSLVPIPITDHGDLEGLLDNDHPQYLLRDEWLQNGFPDRTEVAMSWDDTSLTLTLQPVGANFRYYYEGILYTETGSITETIPDTEGLWVFYIDGEGSMISVLNPSYEQIEHAILNECLVAYVYWDAVNNDGRLLSELHGSIMSPATHHYLHDIMGAQYEGGLTVGDILVDQNGSLPSHAQFSVSAGNIYDEDIGHTILISGQTATKEVYHTDGSGRTRWLNAEPNYPVAAIGGVIAYTNSGVLTPVSNNYYCLYHVFAVNVKTDANGDYPIIVIPGEAQYLTKAAARDAAETEIIDLTTGNWPVEETVPIATVIYQHKTTMTNAVQAATVSTDTGHDYIDWRNSKPTSSGGSASDHGLLSGLSDDDHLQYLLSSDATDRATFVTNWTALTDGGVTALHSHGGAVTTFLGLTDTPSSYSGETLKVVAVNTGETGLDFDGARLITGNLTVGNTIIKSSGTMELNDLGTGDRLSLIDFHSDDTYTDYGGRILKNSGVNGTFDFNVRGTGGIRFICSEAAPISFWSSGSKRGEMASDGVLYWYKNQVLAGPSPYLYFRHNSDSNYQAYFYNDGGANFYIRKASSSGACNLRIDSAAGDDVSASRIQLFRQTNVGGACIFQIMPGNGSAVAVHVLSGKGTSYLALNSEKVGIGTSSPEQKLHVGAGHILVDNGYAFMAKAPNAVNVNMISFATGTYDVTVGASSVNLKTYGAATRPLYEGDELALLSDLTGSSAAPATTDVTITTGITTTSWVTRINVTGIFQLEMIKFMNNGYTSSQLCYARVYIDGTLIFDSPYVSCPDDDTWYSLLGPGASEYIASMFSSTSLRVDIYNPTDSLGAKYSVIYQELEY